MHKCVTCQKTFDSYPIQCYRTDCELTPISQICLAHPFGKGQSVGYNNGEKQHLCCLNVKDFPAFSTEPEAVTCPKCISFLEGLKSNGNT
jgi:hypothetical protein